MTGWKIFGALAAAAAVALTIYHEMRPWAGINLEPSNIIQLAMLIVTLIIAGAAWRSAKAASKAALSAAKTTEAQMLCQFLDEYSTPDMKNALKRLGDFRFNLPGIKNQKLLEKFRAVATQEDARSLWYPFMNNSRHPYDDKLDDARRKVLWYFKKAYFLFEHGYLPAKLMKIVISTNGYRLLFDVVWPVTRVRHLAELTEKMTDIDKELKRFDWFCEMHKNFPPEGD